MTKTFNPVRLMFVGVLLFMLFLLLQNLVQSFPLIHMSSDSSCESADDEGEGEEWPDPETVTVGDILEALRQGNLHNKIGHAELKELLKGLSSEDLAALLNELLDRDDIVAEDLERENEDLHVELVNDALDVVTVRESAIVYEASSRLQAWHTQRWNDFGDELPSND